MTNNFGPFSSAKDERYGIICVCTGIALGAILMLGGWQTPVFGIVLIAAKHISKHGLRLS